VTQRVVVAPFVLFALFFSVRAFSQSLPDVATVKDLPATESPSPKYKRISPISINRQSGIVHFQSSTARRKKPAPEGAP